MPTTTAASSTTKDARLIAQAADAGAALVALPEYFCLMGRRDDDKLRVAEAAGDGPIQRMLADADERHGAPRDAAGARIDFWIVGMGKLGARELNVSSDIDLIYVYEDEGQTEGAADGTRVTSAHEYFAWVAKRLYALIGETTEDGFVFRVDLALRPNGN